MDEKIIKGGLDIGNKNLKVCGSENNAHEIPVAYEEVSKYDYDNELVSKDIEKVFYNDKYYFVGLQCQRGLPQNKGDIAIREIANMFKLVGLARELRERSVSEGEFYLVTGTPVVDYDEYKGDYTDLMLSQDKEYELIELNNEQYKIKVSKVRITKQSACIAPTIPNWRETDFILMDFGGGTLDIAFFQRGVKERYLTLKFPLNEILEDLGNVLNVYKLGLPRPNSLDSGFIKTMEDVVLKGMYRNKTSIEINGEIIKLDEFCSDWLQSKVDNIIEDVKIRLGLSQTDSESIEIYYIGGGSKLLSKELAKNTGFKNKKIIENPHFANVVIYHTMANSIDWE